MRASSPPWLAQTLSRSWAAQWPDLPDALTEAAKYCRETRAPCRAGTSRSRRASRGICRAARGRARAPDAPAHTAARASNPTTRRTAATGRCRGARAAARCRRPGAPSCCRELGGRRRAAGAALVVEHDAPERRIVEAAVMRQAAAAGPAVDEQQRNAVGVAAFLPVHRVPARRAGSMPARARRASRDKAALRGRGWARISFIRAATGMRNAVSSLTVRDVARIIALMRPDIRAACAAHACPADARGRAADRPCCGCPP